MEKIMLAGSTGYLGSYILSELLKRNYSVKAVVRNKSKIKEINDEKSGISLKNI